MSEMAKDARAAMRAKARRMTGGDPHQKVDASSWTPPEPLNATAQTGARPVSPRAYKFGGKIQGDRGPRRADKRARASGGKAEANAYVNRDAKEANAEFGKPHVGGYRKGGAPEKCNGGMARASGGRVHMDDSIRKQGSRDGVRIGNKTGHPEMRMAKKDGGSANFIKGAIKHPGALHKELKVPEGKKIPEKKLEKAAHAKGKEGERARFAETLKKMPHKADGGSAGDSEAVQERTRDMMGRKDGGSANYTGGTRPTGGRIARAHGGKTGKGKTNINIIIGAKGDQPPPSMMTPPGPVRPPVPPQMPPGMPPGGAPPPGGPPMGAGAPSPGMPPGMGRKSGGRTLHMTAGAGSGLGRIEKARAAGHSIR